MDPNETLEEIRRLIAELRALPRPKRSSWDEVSDLMGKVEALDQWMTRGGYTPREWRSGRRWQ